MTRFTDDIYRHWLHQNQGMAKGGQAQRRTPLAVSRGMGRSPMSDLSRPACPPPAGAEPPGRRGQNGAEPSHPPALSGPEPPQGAPPRGAAAANDGIYSRPEKQVFDYVDNLKETIISGGGKSCLIHRI